MEEPQILYEEKDFLAVYKPAGMLMHALRALRMNKDIHVDARGMKDKLQITNGDGETLADWVCVRYPETARVGDDPKTRPGVVHRLDRDTSGVVLVARTQEAFQYFKLLFQKGEISKTYLALVYGKLVPREGSVEKPISLKSGTIRHTVHSGKMTKYAITHYKVLRYIGCREDNREKCFSFLEAYPKTGRTHQIRVHMASIGHPIVGDALYGKKNRDRASRVTGHESLVSRLMLHAYALEFTAPSGKRIRVEAEPPEEFSNYVEPLIHSHPFP